MDSFSVLVVAAAQVSHSDRQEEYRIIKKKKKNVQDNRATAGKDIQDTVG